MTDDEDTPDLRPDDPEEQRRYVRRMRARYATDLAGVSPERLQDIVRAGLEQCPALEIKHPLDVMRFVALAFLITPEQRQSKLLDAVLRRVLGAVSNWPAGKRLDFVYQHVVGRPPPDPEPDFGPWYLQPLPPPEWAP